MMYSRHLLGPDSFSRVAIEMCRPMPQTSNGTPNGTASTKGPYGLAKFWSNLHVFLTRSLNIRLCQLDFSVTIASALVLSVVRYSLEFLLVTLFKWPVPSLATKKACSSLAAVCHSSILCPGLISCFLQHTYCPNENLRDTPLWYQRAADALLQFTTGYMLYDTVLNCLWMSYSMEADTSEIPVFIVHHAITVFYMTSTRVVGAGHQSAMMCMLLGEITNPFHNSYYAAIEAQKLSCCSGGAFSHTLWHIIRLSFAVAYFGVRALVAPWALAHLSWKLWVPRNPRIPVILLIFWTFLIWVIEIGSLPYIKDCWDMAVSYGPVEWNLPTFAVAAAITPDQEL